MKSTIVSSNKHKRVKKSRRRLFLLTLYIAIILTYPIFGYAEQNQSNAITVSPAINEIKINPGQAKIGEMVIINPTDSPLALRVYALSFEPADLFGTLKFVDNKEVTALPSWLSFDKQLLVPPKQSKKFKYKIDTPKEAEPGGQYASLFFETINLLEEEAEKDNDTRITKRVGALFMVTVNGDIRETGRVLGASSSDKCSGLDCSFDAKKLREWGPVPFTFKFENTGNVHVKVRGKIEIFNIFRQKVGEIPVDEKTVLPEATRQLDATWLREPLFGYYRAKLTINYGTYNSQDKAEVWFFAFPWKIAILCLIVVTALLYYRKRKKRKRARTEQEWSSIRKKE